MNYGVRIHGAPGLLVQDVLKDFEGSLRGFLPTEVSRPLEAETLGTRAQLAIEQEVGQRADDLVLRVRIEQDCGAVDDLGKSRSVLAGNGAPAGHRFEGGKAEAFVERRKHEEVAGVVEL